MAATFRPVNTPMAIDIKRDDRPEHSPPLTPTPTKTTFAQRPLPPFPQAVQIPDSIEEKSPTKRTPKRDHSQHSQKSQGSDVDMDDSDGENQGDDGAGSDASSVNGDGTKSDKKKKSQRFYCTDYPPCHLSFTRSEHLARHIRKHTGERPFQCHCQRRFSRLDNLRQHAQTVHVNEDIPIDSLAATSTRFQRQVRTDQMRQPRRARAQTGGSIGTPTRGHAKSLSTSSISSVGSNFSNREDVRRRPPPLVMADPRSRLSIETYPPESPYAFRPLSPSEFSTPTSATFSTGQNSPRWGSAIASPNSAHPRPQSMYAAQRRPTRRLSVPSGGIPFQSPHGAALGRPLFGPGPINTSNPGAFSPTSSTLGSPTTPGFSPRRESVSQTEDWRRRTWHPDSTNFAMNNSRLSNVVTPSQFQSPDPTPLPLAAPPPQQNTTLRLPGIESFGLLPHRPPTPPRMNPAPMVVDSEISQPQVLLPARHTGNPDEAHNRGSWDMGLHRGLTRLDITSNNPPPPDTASTWAHEANRAVEAQADRIRHNPPTVRFNEPVVFENRPPVATGTPPRAYHKHAMSAPSITTSRETKRRGWYNGPVTVHADAPPEKIARVERMVHPNINEFPGFPVRENAVNSPPGEEKSGGRDNMLRLQALVAVATSEGNAATPAF